MAKPEPKPKHHDAHVRARAAIVRRVVNRWVDWGALDRTPWEARWRAAYRALSKQHWRDGWGDRLSTYEPFGSPQRVVGQLRDVPAHIIHEIMCRAMGYARDEMLARKKDRVVCVDPADDLVAGEVYEVVAVKAGRLVVSHPSIRTSPLLTHIPDRFVPA